MIVLEYAKKNVEKTMAAPKYKKATHDLSRVKKVFGVFSGKGGVGKSLVSSLLAVLANREGYKTALLDADITGPSIPRMFGLKGGLERSHQGMFPRVSRTGIKIMSANFLLREENDPIMFRGPIISDIIKQFWQDVIWGDIDVMFIDFPPGTGDIPLTLFQNIQLDGMIIVTSPQEIVSMIVSKAIRMANTLGKPVIGIIENMSYINCPKCGERVSMFEGESTTDISKFYNIPILARMPVSKDFVMACDNGTIEEVDASSLKNCIKYLGLYKNLM